MNLTKQNQSVPGRVFLTHPAASVNRAGVQHHLGVKFKDDSVRGLTEFELCVFYELGRVKLKVLHGKKSETKDTYF